MEDIIADYRLKAREQRLAAENEANATEKWQHLQLADIYDGRADLLKEGNGGNFASPN